MTESAIEQLRVLLDNHPSDVATHGCACHEDLRRLSYQPIEAFDKPMS